MKRIFLVLALMMALLSGCMVPPTNTIPAPVETEVPALQTVTEPAPATEESPNPKLPTKSFESRTYINDRVGFALDYPTGWSVNESVVGGRGDQYLVLSGEGNLELGNEILQRIRTISP